MRLSCLQLRPKDGGCQQKAREILWRWNTRKKCHHLAASEGTPSRRSLNFHDGDIGQLPYGHCQGLGFWEACTMCFLLFFIKPGLTTTLTQSYLLFSCFLISSNNPFPFSLLLSKHFPTSSQNWERIWKYSRETLVVTDFLPLAHLTDGTDWPMPASEWAKDIKPSADQQKLCNYFFS